MKYILLRKQIWLFEQSLNWRQQWNWLIRLKSIALSEFLQVFLLSEKDLREKRHPLSPENYQTDPAEIWHTHTWTVMLLFYENGTVMLLVDENGTAPGPPQSRAISTGSELGTSSHLLTWRVSWIVDFGQEGELFAVRGKECLTNHYLWRSPCHKRNR